MHRRAFAVTPFFPAFLAFLAFLAPATAKAEGETRVRFDLFVGVMAGEAQGRNVSTASIAPALKLDLGVQIGEHAAVFARAEGGTLLLADEGAAYLASEWTPVPALSLGTGIGYEGISFNWPGSGACDANRAPCIQNSWSGVSVPLFVAFNIPPHRRDPAGESSYAGVRLELEGAGGYDATSETWGFHFFAGVGWRWM
jgi:hypothetical protein